MVASADPAPAGAVPVQLREPLEHEGFLLEGKPAAPVSSVGKWQWPCKQHVSGAHFGGRHQA